LDINVDFLPQLIGTMRAVLLPFLARHVLAKAKPDPPTRDPFDRTLLAQCAVEDLQFIAMTGHLAFAR
jgi:PIN domain nuclease of toxin-antitoxin system